MGGLGPYIGIKRQPWAILLSEKNMSFYITLISDQAQGKGQKFTARLPHLHYLVEDDWEVALVHISHPAFNQQLEHQTKQNWTQEDSQKHWMKTDIRYMPKRADGTAPLQVTKQIHLPPGYYSNLKEAWIAIAYEMEKTTHGGHDGYSKNGRGRSIQTTTASHSQPRSTLRQNHQYWRRFRIRFPVCGYTSQHAI